MAEPAFTRDVVFHQSARTVPICRFITATSLFDGHDAAINIIRRILQSQGVEVIHLGHDRSVREVVNAAIQEDVDGIAVSSYQGGHLEYFKYLIDELHNQDASSIKVFGGGGGVILPGEIIELEEYGVTRIYSPDVGQELGLEGMVADVIQLCNKGKNHQRPERIDGLFHDDWKCLAGLLTRIEKGHFSSDHRQILVKRAAERNNRAVVLGITGTGGAGKSSLTDELIQRFRIDFDDQLTIAIIAIDPSHRKTGGALLGDRIRMNTIDSSNIFMRSLANRDVNAELPRVLPDFIAAMKAWDFDLVIVETPGIGQGDTGIVPMVDTVLYVMTGEYGTALQLEKIAILDFADFVAINKFDRKGSDDALRDVKKQLQRSRVVFAIDPAELPVYGTIASHVNDEGITTLYHGIRENLLEHGLKRSEANIKAEFKNPHAKVNGIIPPSRQQYLCEIAQSVRHYQRDAEKQCRIARELQQLLSVKRKLTNHDLDALDLLIDDARSKLSSYSKRLLQQWDKNQKIYGSEEVESMYRGQSIKIRLSQSTLSGTSIPKVALPRYHDDGDILHWLYFENLPGYFPFTAGVFPFKRRDEEPTRMFAGEGDAFRTNRRFKHLASQSEATRLSTAFDSVTLYGSDPDNRPDIYGRIGNSGVSIATLDDMKILYDGFDLCDPKTSVSMTINGPSPIILAMFFNTAIDQQVERFEKTSGRESTKEEFEKIKADTLNTIRGTVQADILKEDQGQNTCIFSTEFSLKLMGDVQEYFVEHQINHFYSVSISGYHIAEAGANPITQLAFTLANGFTYVEAFLARGLAINDFASNLSFFFSNGMDAEYGVIGRVARRIWAIAMAKYYDADTPSQKLKYHIQTSGRSLHAPTVNFNDIRTTLQALIAVYDNCNSLHTNASDEAITTPTEESLRHALAVQMIINKEWGMAKNENLNQGSFFIEQLSDSVEHAVLQEFDRLSERGGVLGAMETGYQRSKIQDESLKYEAAKHDGTLPIVGVNLFRSHSDEADSPVQLARSIETEKRSQIQQLQKFKKRNEKRSQPALRRLKQAVMNKENVFSELMGTVQVCSLGQITDALFAVGGRYRRNL